MKNILKWFSILSLSATAAFAAEPLLLQWGSIDTSGSEAQTESAALKAKVAKKAALARARKSAAAAGERAAYVVQFAGPVSEAQRSWLEAATQVRGYLPENAYIVWATAPEMESIAASSDVFWTGEWKKEYKTVRTAAAKRAAAASDEARWMQVGSLLAGDEGAADLRARLEALPATVRSAFPRLDGVSAVAYLTDAQVDEVATWADVDWIEPKLKPILRNDKAALTNMMNVTPAWKAISSGGLGLTGAGQVVAVADTGCDKGSTSDIHADFSGRIKAGYGWTNGAYKSSASWADYDAHGTHVCGSVLGSGAQSSGQFRGIAYEAQLVMQGCWEDLGGLPDNAQDLFKQAYSQGARIHSDSWGFDTNLAAQYVYDAVYADGYMWTNQNFLALFAAGNDGIDKNKDGVIDPGSVTPPSTAKNCLCVGAAENYRSSGGYSSYTWGGAWGSDYPTDPIKSDKISGTTTPQGLAAFSSRGPTEDGRFKPDIVAPGTDIISVRSRSAQDDGWGVYTSNTNYLYEGGTSMATPLTSGATTLVRQWLVDRQGIAEPMAALMKALLINGARDMTPGQYGTGSTQEITARPDRSQGFGHVNLYNALEPGDGNFLVFATNKFTSTGANYTTNIAVGQANAGKYILTLAWQDYPGTSGASKTLVNDLDLTVTSPSGTVYYPNNYGTLDHTNNVEFIEFTATEVGSYAVKVNAYKISKTTGVGSQPFALVMRGPETVLEPASPEFTSATSATEGVQNSDIEFTFSALLSAGYPAPTYSITTAVSTDEYDFDGDTGYLYFQPANAGTFTFTCVASNEYGSATNTLTVTVTLAQPPAPPEPTVVASDSFTAIWTAVSGATGYELVVVEGAAGGSGGGNTYTLVTSADGLVAGDYLILADGTDCAMNNICSGSASGYLSPTDVTVDGTTISNEDASLVWTLAGTADSCTLFNADAGKYVNPSTSKTIGWSDTASGAWTLSMNGNLVTAANAASTTWMLQYNSGSPRFTCYNSAQKKLRFFSRGASRALPRAAGDVVFSNSVGNVTSYQVTGLQPNTTYSYSYRAIVDGQATPWSESTAVTTSEGDAAPVWSELPAQTVNVGDDTSIQLADYVAGSPTPAITLDSTTAASADYEFEDGLLVFQPSAPGTFTFTFTASNSVGTSTATLTVTAVAEAPVLSASLGTSVAAVVGDDVEFTVTATGIPAPTVAMVATEHDAVFIDGAFAFAPTSVGTYTFTFTASNVAGSDTLTVTVTVTAAPVTVPEFLVENVTDTTAHARWTECTGVASYTLQLASDDQFTTGGAGGTVLDESFDGTSAPSGWTISDGGTYSSSPYVSGTYSRKFTKVGQYAVTPEFGSGSTLQFWAYGNGGSGSIFTISGLVNSVWTFIDTVTIAQGASTNEVTLPSGTSQVGFYFTTRSVNCALDDVVVYGASGSGSLIRTETVSATSYTFTGLEPETTYYARVKGDAGWSTVVDFTTASAGDSAPVWSASFPATATVNVDEFYTLDNVSSYVSGSPAPTITMAGPAGVEAELADDTFTFAAEASGDYAFTFTAANGISPDATATLVVTAVGQAPVLTASQGTTVAAVVGDTVEFTVTATGIPVPTVAMAATEYDAIFENGEFLFAPDAVGTYAFTFTAENTEGTDTLTVTVTVAPAPVTVPELAVTDITDTTALATWTACDGVTEYTLQLSTNDFAAASGASVRSATPILSEDFSGVSGTSAIANFDDVLQTNGWLGEKVYAATNAVRIGTSSAAGSLQTPPLTSIGTTVRVVWSSFRWPADGETAHVGISEDGGSTFTDQTVTLTDDWQTYTNTFEVSANSAIIRWSTVGSSKKRFYIDDIAITTFGDTPAGDDVQEFTVPGTSYEFTDLTPYTVYYARVKGNAAWSDTEEFITEEAPTPGTAPAWSSDFPATATVTAGEDYEFPNVSSYATGTPSPTIELTAADSADCSFDSESDYFLFNTATPGTYTFTFTASNVLGTADAILTVTVTATPSDFEQWLADHAASGHAAGETAPNGRTYWDNYIADIDPGDTYLAIEIADPSAGTFTIPAASPNRTYTLLWTTNLATGDYQQQDLGAGAPSTSIPFPTPADWYGGLQVTLPSDP